ncbi:DnaJ [Quillaja saponaria]|uniref:DnaJ n=1 Tax=Quillaja saponaria TaxID=32244 RepID=A0AAD7M4Z5_QUISA|nr:DnaJ [Quillaja saponaria]
MECNKDEAIRAKEIAERKFTAKDIPGAKKFALKAQSLFPGLEGIPQMLATLDVYIAAENKIYGEADWYGILNVDTLADDETVRKHYRKLALMLHPDKNKSIGAEGAFKHISEAWSLLSDKAKKGAYDQKRNRKPHKLSTPNGGSSAPQGVNGFSNFSKTTTSSARAPKSTVKGAQSSTPAVSQKSKPAVSQKSKPGAAQKSKSNTFWTVCHRCKMQYEYLRVYLNLKLLCPNCHEPFLALETAPPPSNGSKPPTLWDFSQQQQKHNHQVPRKGTSNAGRNRVANPNVGAGCFSSTDSYKQTKFQWGQFSRTHGASTASQAASVVQQAYEKVKREREEAQAATKREEALRKKQHVSKKTGGLSSSSNSAKRRRGMEGTSTSGNGRVIANQMGVGTGVIQAANPWGSEPHNVETGGVVGIINPSSTRDVSLLEAQNLLIKKAMTEIRKKLSELKTATLAKDAVKESRNGLEKENELGNKSLRKSDTCDQNKSGRSEVMSNEACILKSFPVTTAANMDAETISTMFINVPESDFHDFDKDRTERSFRENQVWAAYDDHDGMPRYYAMIHSVISLDPFTMRISWLHSKTNSELNGLTLVGSGFSKPCGDFRIGKCEIIDSLNSFSHKVKWSKGNNGAICIYPRKGDVWALYRNWSSDWNDLTAYEVIHKYDMVEVLEDYTDELGVTVIPLVKVAGFKTLFHHHLDLRQVRRIPREEMFLFSHYVPSYLLRGQEGPNALKGCQELDPAATPLELLQVITDFMEEDIVENGEKGREETMVDNVWKADVENKIDDMISPGEERNRNADDIHGVEILDEATRKEDKQESGAR